MGLKREEWLDLARGLDWTFSYAEEAEVFPTEMSGRPALPREAWEGWDEPYKTSYREYVQGQTAKDASVAAVREVLGRPSSVQGFDPAWLSAVKLHAATLPLAEYAAVIGNLGAARFGRDAAWRTTALFGALDELRHTQIPLVLMHDLVRHDARYDFCHKLYHSNTWVSIAARHAFDEMLLSASAIEMAIATNFVFETGFTNLQFIGLSELSERVGDHLFEKMVTSIQTDEARHAQIGPAVLRVVAAHDRAYAQYLADKWFWRSWLLFAIVTGLPMDYLTPLSKRGPSFKEFVEEWVLEQYLETLDDVGLEKPWYWDTFLSSLETYHHMVYLSAYTYRATVWFDMVVPGPAERTWLHTKYPASWPAFDEAWQHIAEQWSRCDPGIDFGVHGTAIPAFCHLCQIVLCQGSPERNQAVVIVHEGQKRIFCSEPCRWIFEQEPERYAEQKDIVQRVLSGEAPGNLIAFLSRYSGLTYETWGKDAFQGRYPWLSRQRR